jgi:glycosyltransferase involved in cell wall biosynthesis
MALIARRLRRFIKAHEIDVVFSPMDSIWQSLSLWLYLPRSVAYVSGIHDASAHPGDRHPLKDACRWLEFRRADVVLTYSAAVAATIAERRLTRAPVMSTVHGAFKAPGEAPREPRSAPEGREWRLGFFGRLLRYKGLDLFVDVVRRLAEMGMPVRGVVFGDGDGGDVISGAQGVPIDWHIGWVAADDVNTVVASMDIVLLPYVEASQSGVVSLAMAEGVPVVVTPVGGLAEQVTETACGVVSASVDAAAVADVTHTLINDSVRYQSASRAGLAAAQTIYSWDRVARDVLRCARVAADGRAK